MPLAYEWGVQLEYAYLTVHAPRYYSRLAPAIAPRAIPSGWASTSVAAEAPSRGTPPKLFTAP
eukprot:COSAG04_NODE_5265_length_1681_cov_1.182680_1_plen_62_part_10